MVAIGKCTGGDGTTGLDNSATVNGADPGAVGKMRFVSSDALNCRSAARVSAKVVSRFAFGDSVTVRQEKEGWSEVDVADTPCWIANRYLVETYPIRMREPRSYTPAPRAAVRPRRERRLQCSGKRTCGEMNSCAEANFYLDECGVSRLDGDGDGVPCESICG
ncbi:MAG TPA: excalibur calcium-binding domain-containing protein [Allosphingosinicella sp.]